MTINPPGPQAPARSERITREEIERVCAVFTTGSRLTEDETRALVEASLDHPAALEAARAEERERCARRLMTSSYKINLRRDNNGVADRADPLNKQLIAAKVALQGEAAAIRALGPAVEQPAAPAAWLIFDEQDDPRWIAHSPEEAEVIAARVDPPRAIRPVYDEPPHSGRVKSTIADATTRAAASPALSPDLREQIAAALKAVIDCGTPCMESVGPKPNGWDYLRLDAMLPYLATLLSALREPPEWLPTHKSHKGELVREIIRCNGPDGDELVPLVIYEDAAGHRVGQRVERFDGEVGLFGDDGNIQRPCPRRFRPLTPAEARAAMEAGRG